MDRRQAVVAGRRRVAPLALDVVEEGGDQRRVKRCDIELARRLAGPLRGEP